MSSRSLCFLSRLFSISLCFSFFFLALSSTASSTRRTDSGLTLDSSSTVEHLNSTDARSHKNPRDYDEPDASITALAWGISLGLTALIALVVSLSCVYCSCCPLYRRRHRGLVQPQPQQFPMTQQNLSYYYDSAGNLVMLNQAGGPYYLTNRAHEGQAGMTAEVQTSTLTTTDLPSYWQSPAPPTAAPPPYKPLSAPEYSPSAPNNN